MNAISWTNLYFFPAIGDFVLLTDVDEGHTVYALGFLKSTKLEDIPGLDLVTLNHFHNSPSPFLFDQIACQFAWG